ncbi:hypothetical protein [Streptomyces malaysiensis]|uniref:Uncharacterized protein n=1 Tax=Streptomyces malaysiensis subsp. samsunensis TaxID=459658 RepID=A0A9X2LXU2_STRMQ|nr:hypothetical protein [Streptomyces samsunensis]MCQ8831798.1 hypothetical protein [Streptomyces samsunensis]
MLLVFYAFGMAACLACMYFIRRLSESHRTTIYACPVKGCGVSIQAVGSSDAELERLRNLAVDHSKHGPDA